MSDMLQAISRTKLWGRILPSGAFGCSLLLVLVHACVNGPGQTKTTQALHEIFLTHNCKALICLTRHFERVTLDSAAWLGHRLSLHSYSPTLFSRCSLAWKIAPRRSGVKRHIPSAEHEFCLVF